MIEYFVAFGIAFLFGLGISFSLLGFVLLHRAFFNANSSNFILICLSLILITTGMTFLHVVIL